MPHRGTQYWKEDGESWGQLYDRLPFWSPRRVVARFLDARTRAFHELLPDVEGKSVLDVGCGSGVHLRTLAPRAARVVGVDVSEDLLSRARANLESLGARNWSVLKAGAERLPFPDGSFDAIAALGLLDYVSDPEAVLRECRRVLSADGVMIVTFPKRPSLFSFLRSGAGSWLRGMIFGLPQISHAWTRDDLDALLGSAHLRGDEVRSVWSAMWIVKASPTE